MSLAPGARPEDLARAIHEQPLRLVLAVTGGGSRAIADLLETPGGSRTILEAVVPYSAAALTDWLAARPEHFCHERTARAMAMAAFERAGRLAAASDGPAAKQPLADGPTTIAGIGATASLASSRPKRGPHRAHVALHTAGTTARWSIELAKGQRDRRAEERLVADLVLNAAAQAAGVEVRLALPLRDGEQVEIDRFDAPPAWSDLLLGKIEIAAGAPGRPFRAPATGGARRRRVVFTGSFNPLHDGHRRMAALASERLGSQVEWHITVYNVDKPALDFIEMARRAAQFGPDEALWFTRAATFVEQSRIFPGTTFIVGVDTIARLADARYYGDDERACTAALDEIAELDGRFLVFGRRKADGFRVLEDIAIPERLRALCDGVSEVAFRNDISSTELRRADARAQGAED
jgi:hypothetical protein